MSDNPHELDEGIEYEVTGNSKLSFHELYYLARDIARSAEIFAQKTKFETCNFPESIESFVRLLAKLLAKCNELTFSLTNTTLERSIMASRQLRAVESLGKEYPTALHAVHGLGLKVVRAALGPIGGPFGVPNCKNFADLTNASWLQGFYRHEFVRVGLNDSVEKWRDFLSRFRQRLPDFSPQTIHTNLRLEEAAAEPVVLAQQTSGLRVELPGDTGAAIPTGETAHTKAAVSKVRMTVEQAKAMKPDFPASGCGEREGILGEPPTVTRNEAAEMQTADDGAVKDTTADDGAANKLNSKIGGHLKPAKYLMNWCDILVCLDLKNNEVEKRQVAQLNRKFEGPINLPGRGGQPKVEKTKLLEWWNSLENRWGELRKRRVDQQSTTEDQYQHGKDGTVVPGIGGHIKKKRRGKE